MNFNLKNWIQVLMLTLLVGFAACTEDACESTDCGPNSVDCQEGVCVCTTGWYGEFCDQYDCNISGLGCVNGDCLPDGTCDCEEGFYGGDCSSTDPGDNITTCDEIDCGPNSVDCVDGECICADGFYGADCSSSDPCVETVCGDNAAAVQSADGLTCDCECLPGFTGENCDQEIAASFLGDYSVVSSCGTDSYLSSIVPQTENNVVIEGKVKITNFSNLIDPDSQGDYNVVADIVSENELSILVNASGYTVIGSAFFTDATNDVVVINYEITDNASGTSQNCSDTYTRL